MRAWLALILLNGFAYASAYEDELARAHFLSGQSYFDEGRFTDALNEFREAYRISRVPGFQYNLGVCEEGLERWQEAAAAFEQCAFLMPRLYWAHYGLGVCLHRLGQLAAATVSLRRSLALEPETEEGHRALQRRMIKRRHHRDEIADHAWFGHEHRLWRQGNGEIIRQTEAEAV